VVLWAGRRGDPLADDADAGLLELSVLDVLLAARHVRSTCGSRPGGSARGSALGVMVRACAS
jgi:hypothetical protein